MTKRYDAEPRKLTEARILYEIKGKRGGIMEYHIIVINIFLIFALILVYAVLFIQIGFIPATVIVPPVIGNWRRIF